MEKPKKILILLSSLKLGGGAERVASVLGTELNKRGYPVDLLTYYNYKERYVFEGEYYSFNEVLESSVFVKFKKLITRPLAISKFCKDHHTDIVISFIEKSNFYAILSKIFKNKSKIIACVHNNPETNYQKGIVARVTNYLIKKLYPRADKIVVVSKEIKEILCASYKIPRNKIEVMYNPHNINQYIEKSTEPLEERYLKIFKNSYVFINIGRLSEQKAQWYLIRSFKKVTEKHKNAKLIILGDGELKGELINLVKKLNLGGSVFLLGNQTNPFKLLKHSQCFVLTSLWEGLPNALIEALSVNLPIISTDCKTGPREILEPELKINEEIKYPHPAKYGILIKPFERKMVFEDLNDKPLTKQEKDFAELMIEIMENNELGERYKKGIERARDFDIEKTIKEWEGLFKNYNDNKL
ncbi:MAG: glycosyltransferase [Candidatus Altiarchaeales archaeon WOR_SM1_79]|nr:MAG: glycosyltransferase [Candidatus Altiarchaeales archaeon WOR_SM1_79]